MFYPNQIWKLKKNAPGRATFAQVLTLTVWETGGKIYARGDVAVPGFPVENLRCDEAFENNYELFHDIPADVKAKYDAEIQPVLVLQRTEPEPERTTAQPNVSPSIKVGAPLVPSGVTSPPPASGTGAIPLKVG